MLRFDSNVPSWVHMRAWERSQKTPESGYHLRSACWHSTSPDGVRQPAPSCSRDAGLETHLSGKETMLDTAAAKSAIDGIGSSSMSVLRWNSPLGLAGVPPPWDRCRPSQVNGGVMELYPSSPLSAPYRVKTTPTIEMHKEPETCHETTATK